MMPLVKSWLVIRLNNLLLQKVRSRVDTLDCREAAMTSRSMGAWRSGDTSESNAAVVQSVQPRPQ